VNDCRTSTDDTIAAVTSASGGAARGIVRISGHAALACIGEFFQADDAGALSVIPSSQAHVVPGRVRLPQFSSPVPCAAYVWPSDRSYTRQPTVELHLPGSPPLVAAALEVACSSGARPARPGEFTLRAFLAGRLDLTQAEAVLGVVDAADRRQLDVALRQMAGGLAGPLDRLRSDLLDATAHLEAGLDFVDEDIEFIARDELLRQLAAARAAVADVVRQTVSRGDAAELPRVALIGLPNVGKSSLFNALLGKPGALVSPQAGTTRDYLTARCSLGSIDCELIDTAGFEHADVSANSIAAAAQQFAEDRLRDADVRVLCLDACRAPASWELRLLGQFDDRRIVVRTKSDLADAMPKFGELHVSAVTGAGLDELRQAVASVVAQTQAVLGEMVTATTVRCRDSLQRAGAALAAAEQLAQTGGGDELIAVELRTALDELGQVVGTVYTDDILDRIFSRFCIGK